jgi:hypothetical protein
MIVAVGKQFSRSYRAVVLNARSGAFCQCGGRDVVRLVAALAWFIVLADGSAHTAFAQDHGNRRLAWDSQLDFTPYAAGAVNELEAPDREYGAVPIAGWLVYTSALTGLVFDDNLFQTHSDKTSDWGVRLRPSFAASKNNGIHKTTVYGFADAKLYRGEEDADIVDALAGASHVWEVQRDFVVRMDGSISRQTDLNNPGIIATADGVHALADPLTYNEVRGSASLQKSFGSLFFNLGSVVSYTAYDNVEDVLGQTFDQSGRDETHYTISGRAGAWLGPVFYAFIEPSQNWRRFGDEGFNSQGQRIVAGIGSDRFSLFRGEIFAGYQRQAYDSEAIGTVSGNVLGGRLSWYPTRDLEFGLQADRTIGDSTFPTPGNDWGSPVDATSVVLRGDYELTRIWSLSAVLGYTHANYEETVREDDQWIVGTTISYALRRNVSATFDFRHTELDSNIAANSFSRNVYTVGATYKY